MSNQDETQEINLSFGRDGLVGAIVVDAASKDVLMFAHMNAEAFAKTRASGQLHFYSRSRQKLWMKGETSGEKFNVVSMHVDCDQDCLLIAVSPGSKGNACHTGRRSCFYREIKGEKLAFTA
jgi:phosphoribosyl-AMP cyclohydrolase